MQVFPTSSFQIAGIINWKKHFPLHYDPQERRWFGLQQDKERAACGIFQSRMKDKTRMQMSCLFLDKSYGNQAKQYAEF